MDSSIDIDTLLDHMRDGAVRNMSGTLLHEIEVSANGHYGREFKVQAPNSHIVRTKMFIVGKTLYFVSVESTPSLSFSDDVGRFLNSFQLQPMDP
jgi:hypothetical protein